MKRHSIGTKIIGVRSKPINNIIRFINSGVTLYRKKLKLKKRGHLIR